MRRDGRLLGVIAGAAVAAYLVACGAGAPRTAAPGMAGDAASPMHGLDGRATPAHDEIRALDGLIASDLASIGAEAPTDVDVTEAVVAHEVPAVPAAGSPAIEACEVPPAGPACADVCTVTNSICDNARRICELADELAPDEWATQRCAAGRLSCERARARCCGCDDA